MFGFDAIAKLIELAENLDERHGRNFAATKKSDNPRARRPNTKEQVVVQKEFKNKQLELEMVAELDYTPGTCGRTYRMVVLHKQVSVTQGQRKLIDDSPFFFYITNASSTEMSAEDIVLAANKRVIRKPSSARESSWVRSPPHCTPRSATVPIW